MMKNGQRKFVEAVWALCEAQCPASCTILELNYNSIVDEVSGLPSSTKKARIQRR
jgi:hypothetical protein